MRTRVLMMVFLLEYLGVEARPQITSFNLLQGSTSWKIGEPRILPDLTEILPLTQPVSIEKLKSSGFSFCNKLLTLNPHEVFTLSIPVDGKSCLIYMRAPKGYLLEQRSLPIVWFAGCDKEQLRFSSGPYTMVYCDGGYQLNFHGNQDHVAIMYEGVTHTYRQVIKLSVALKPEASSLPGSKKDITTGIGEIVWRDPEAENKPRAVLEMARQDDNLQICPVSCGASNNDGGAYSLVFGEPAEEGEIPYLARVNVVYKTPGREDVTPINCGGTILNSRHILTAAHCLLDPEKLRWEVVERFVYATDVNVNEEQEINFDEFAIHPEYKARIKDATNKSYRAYDIAVVKLPYDLRLGRNSWPICLAPAVDLANQRATTSSFGQITRDDLEGLWKAGAVVADYDTKCKKFDLFRLPENRFRKACTFGMAKDTCRGDAGSPVAVSEGSVWYQVGVATGGYCGRPGEPHFHVNVTTFADFIKQNVQSGSCH